MPVNPELLEILVCPETRQKLRNATDGELSKLEALYNSGALHDRSGNKVASAVKEGLVREDGQVLYVVDEGIPIMLTEESIELEVRPHR
tara:strand:+ start:1342 stop:1608 length:267 start_codon:yes stop_codon:yes gene_type:complete